MYFCNALPKGMFFIGRCRVEYHYSALFYLCVDYKRFISYWLRCYNVLEGYHYGETMKIQSGRLCRFENLPNRFPAGRFPCICPPKRTVQVGFLPSRWAGGSPVE